MNVHFMKLNPIPFRMITSGEKTIEMRLFDEKRRRIQIGDRIVFENKSTGQTVKTEVLNLHLFSSFNELYQALPLLKCGYTAENIDFAKSTDMDRFYTVEMQKNYGVVGIELTVI